MQPTHLNVGNLVMQMQLFMCLHRCHGVTVKLGWLCCAWLWLVVGHSFYLAQLYYTGCDCATCC